MTAETRTVVEADARGRVSLARFGIKDTQLSAEATDDGGVILRPAVVLTAAELQHYTDPEAVAGLDRALRSVAEGKLKERPLPD